MLLVSLELLVGTLQLVGLQDQQYEFSCCVCQSCCLGLQVRYDEKYLHVLISSASGMKVNK